jgi:hypothetical protein
VNKSIWKEEQSLVDLCFSIFTGNIIVATLEQLIRTSSLIKTGGAYSYHWDFKRLRNPCVLKSTSTVPA